MIHLDTTFLVDLLRESHRRPGPAMTFLSSLGERELAISVHALCELYAGAELSSDPAREKQAIQRICGAISIRYPDAEFPNVYGHLLATLQRRGQAISAMDLLIASSALLEKAALVTRNLKHFNRVPGLEVLSY